MNILARVAQGVNITVAFDDILELIYAQTDQALPVDDFHITLFNKESNYYYFAFCVEKDDRLGVRENLPSAGGYRAKSRGYPRSPWDSDFRLYPGVPGAWE